MRATGPMRREMAWRRRLCRGSVQRLPMTQQTTHTHCCRLGRLTLTVVNGDDTHSLLSTETTHTYCCQLGRLTLTVVN
jgi:hypothetical protein